GGPSILEHPFECVRSRDDNMGALATLDIRQFAGPHVDKHLGVADRILVFDFGVIKGKRPPFWVAACDGTVLQGSVLRAAFLDQNVTNEAIIHCGDAHVLVSYASLLDDGGVKLFPRDDDGLGPDLEPLRVAFEEQRPRPSLKRLDSASGDSEFPNLFFPERIGFLEIDFGLLVSLSDGLSA